LNDTGPDYEDELALTDVVVSTADVDGIGNEGHIDVVYGKKSGEVSPAIRRIRFPTYRDAGHMVAQHSPQKLFEDVKEFLCAKEMP
jgi:hypothetical protein